MLSTSLDENIRQLEDTFHDCGDLVKRKIPIGQHKDIWIYVAYIDMLINRETLESHVLNPLMVFVWETPPKPEDLQTDLLHTLTDCGFTTADVRESGDPAQLYNAILSGDTVFFVDGAASAIIISTRGWPSRGVSATDTEVTVQGAKDAFTESLRMNTMLIRRRIKDTKLKVKQLRIGSRTQTDVALMYLEDVVRPAVLEETLRRVKSIDIDGILDSGYIAQMIAENKISPFPQAQITERPDKASAAVLEGRIVITADNSPFVVIVPATLNTFMQAAEDYYQGWQIMSFIRLMRYAAGILSACLPGLYIAIAVYHPSMIPALLIYKMAGARQSVPFPTTLEILIMDLAFELLREAGLRLPGPLSGAIGIVGGLIVGQAAVEAGLVSPIAVIIVALTGICGFAIPHFSLVSGLRLSKYFILICSAVLGLLGFWASVLLVLSHLVSLRSFGFPYLFPMTAGEVNHYSDWKDTLFRAPLSAMKKRPIFANPAEDVRMHEAKKG
ncbi:MAG: spore germination protein [Clostridiales bacterium]|jgi:spore germination protein|nr:spore germination protein [Clostridiales bacterium]